jgi:hypothetical protein
MINESEKTCGNCAIKPVCLRSEYMDIFTECCLDWQPLPQPEEKPDVCAWKKTTDKFIPSCTNFHIPELSEHGPEEHGYIFCPYCGRKIEVKV